MNLSIQELSIATLKEIFGYAGFEAEMAFDGADDDFQFLEIRENNIDYRVDIDKDNMHLTFTHYMDVSNEHCSEECLLKISNILDRFPVDATFARFEDSYILKFSYLHVVPDEERISSVYIVKLFKYFQSQLRRHFESWDEILLEAAA